MIENIEYQLFCLLRDRSRGFRVLSLEARFMAGKDARPTWRNAETPGTDTYAGYVDAGVMPVARLTLVTLFRYGDGSRQPLQQHFKVTRAQAADNLFLRPFPSGKSLLQQVSAVNG